MTRYHWDVKVVDVAPGFILGLIDIDLVVKEWPALFDRIEYFLGL